MTLILQSTITGDSLLEKFGVAQSGQIPQTILEEISQTVKMAQGNLSVDDYARIAMRPELARNDSERLVALSAREYLVMVDQSSSMTAQDESPIQEQRNWNRNLL
ncbi:MAG: hypothetical protein AB8G05_23775 [Oligoflexales bacterium]